MSLPPWTGDSYIFLHTKMRNSAIERDIFFWLGKDSSQDEMGACAYKTVELDTYVFFCLTRDIVITPACFEPISHHHHQQYDLLVQH